MGERDFGGDSLRGHGVRFLERIVSLDASSGLFAVHFRSLNYITSPKHASATWLLIASLLWLALSPDVSHAQTASPEEIEDVSDYADASDDMIVVQGRRLRGLAPGDIEPELTLDREDIASFGAGTIGELLEALAPETQSSRGRSGNNSPVLLVNGRRISSRREIRAYPTEAIDRVEILPEEAALNLGFRADQRVVNFVLVDDFLSATVELETEFPTEGGHNSSEIEIGGLKIRNKGRNSFDLEYNKSSSLLESERNVLLEPQSQPFDVLGNFAAPIFGEEIDPALSTALGEPITVIGIPTSAGSGAPSFADIVSNGGAINETDLTPFRTLEPNIDSVSASLAFTRRVKDTIEATFSLGGEYVHRTRLIGLPNAALSLPAANPFSPFSEDVDVFRFVETGGAQTQDTEIFEGNAAFAFLSQPGVNSWSLTGSYNFRSRTVDTQGDLLTDALQAALDANDPDVNPFGDLLSFSDIEERTTRSDTGTGEIEFVTTNELFSLPAGAVSSTLKLGFQTRDQYSESDQDDDLQEVRLARDQGNFQLSVNAPLFDVEDQFPGRFGVNANVAVDELSDFGTLLTYGYGVRWRPVEQVRLRVSVTQEEGAPTISQLGDPLISTPGARIFDFTNGETVFATRLSGGNVNLLADSRRVLSIGATIEPFEEPDLSFTFDYVDSATDNPVQSFPAPTAEIEAAFPERFVRSADGTLLSLDTTPLSFAREDRKEIRTRFTYRKRLSRGGDRRRGSERGRSQRGRSAGGDGARVAAREQRRLNRPRPGRISFSAFHTWRLEESLLIDQELPALDFLNGSALENGAGRPEHEVRVRASYFKNGIGGRVNANWQSATTVSGGAADDIGDLTFSDLGTIDLRLFVNLGDRPALKRKYPWVKDLRVRLTVDNVFNARQDVRDETGAVPFNFQPDVIDPLGRVIGINIRKRFY